MSEGKMALKKFGEFLQETPWRETLPLQREGIDTSGHDCYINFVSEYASTLPPSKLYDEIRTLEDRVGHDRGQRWQPRRLDVDILFCSVGRDSFAKGIPYRVRSSGFRVPHDGFWHRSFLREMVRDELFISDDFLKRTESLEDDK